MNTTSKRTATNYTRNQTGFTSYGRNEVKVTGTENMIAIDNYGSVTSQHFINRLVESGRLPLEFRKKRTQIFTNEFLTETLNNNLDLFPIEF
jgi:hypothetical protein